MSVSTQGGTRVHRTFYHVCYVFYTGPLTQYWLNVGPASANIKPTMRQRLISKSDKKYDNHYVSALRSLNMGPTH